VKFFKRSREIPITLGVGDRVLRKKVIRKERRWWEERPRRESFVVEGLIKEISPSGDYFCLVENGEDVWVKKEELTILEVLEKD